MERGVERDLQHVERMHRRVVVPATIAAVIMAAYLLFSLAAWPFGHAEFVEGDFFKFSLIACLAYFPFIGFLKIIRAIVRWSILQREPSPPGR
jgi:hypothetical protein